MPRAPRRGLDRGLQLVSKRGEERFRIRLSWRDKATGEPRTFEQLLPPNTTRTQARALRDRLFAERMHGTLKPSKELRAAGTAPQTLAKALEQYMDHMRVHRPRTEKSRESLIRVLVRTIGDIPCSRLAPFTVQAFQRKRIAEGAAPGTVNRATIVLRHACKLAVKQGWGWMTRDQYEAIREVELIPEPHVGRTSTWTERDVQKLLGAIQPAMARVVRAALLTGCRQGELLTLRKDQVDLKRGTITLRAETTKSNRTHTLPLVNPELRKLLETAMEASTGEWVFVNEKGRPWGRKAFASHFRRLRLRAGVKGLTFHCMRRTVGTRLINEGAPLEIVSKVLGHSQVAVTAKSYAHLRTETLGPALMSLSVGGHLGDSSPVDLAARRVSKRNSR